MTDRIDYTPWKHEYRELLGGLREKRVFVLFSGGQDSSACLHLLVKAAREFHFSFEAHAGAFPLHRYPPLERKRISTYWEGRGVSIFWHELAEDDRFLERGADPCSICQEIRRKEFHAVLKNSVKDWSRLVLVASYTLWDLVSYASEVLLAGIFATLDEKEPETLRKRFVEISQRFHPFLQMKEGYSVFRPLLRYNGSDVARIVEEENIPTLRIPCRFKERRPKRILEKYYDHTSLRFDYDEVFHFVKQTMGLPDPSAYREMDKERYLTKVF